MKTALTSNPSPRPHGQRLTLIACGLLLAACAGQPGNEIATVEPEPQRKDGRVEQRENATAKTDIASKDADRLAAVGRAQQAGAPAEPAQEAVADVVAPAGPPPLAAAPAKPSVAEAPQRVLADQFMGRRQRLEGRSATAKRVAPASMVRPAPVQLPQVQQQDRERYLALQDNPVQLVAEQPVSTFSIDVDTGSYANVRRMLNAGRLPPADAVRVEEMINYFPYDYARPGDDTPFAVHTEVARAPWNAQRLLMRVALKGQDLAAESLPPANLVFLVDVSGSMRSQAKLPLLKSALKLLVNGLRPQDRIALVTYASGTSVVLESTPGSDRARISNAIDALRAGGSTAGASGIELAYRMAREGHVRGGINRILLATDGDFNVGLTDFNQLKSLVAERRKSGVSLSTLGFGTGNYNERLMEQLADVGDGAYSYIDTLMEAQKVLVSQMTSTLATIARDVKIQVEFNPAAVSEYRLIGYENRMLAREDFNNDKVDAGDIGAGHSVTALYELTPVSAPGLIEPLRYGSDEARPAGRRDPRASELAYVKLRYKRPGEQASRLIEQPVRVSRAGAATQASDEFRFATAIAGFGQILRGGRYTGSWQIADARQLAASGLGNDRFGYRGEAIRLMDLAASLATRTPLALKDGGD